MPSISRITHQISPISSFHVEKSSLLGSTKVQKAANLRNHLASSIRTLLNEALKVNSRKEKQYHFYASVGFKSSKLREINIITRGTANYFFIIIEGF